MRWRQNSHRDTLKRDRGQRSKGHSAYLLVGKQASLNNAILVLQLHSAIHTISHAYRDCFLSSSLWNSYSLRWNFSMFFTLCCNILYNVTVSLCQLQEQRFLNKLLQKLTCRTAQPCFWMWEMFSFLPFNTGNQLPNQKPTGNESFTLNILY